MHFLIPSIKNAANWMQYVLLLIGILILNWRTDTLLVNFSLYGFIFGFFQLIKIQTVFWNGQKQQYAFSIPRQREASLFFKSIFFIFVYFLFCSAHLLFIFVFISKQNTALSSPMHLLDNLSYYFNQEDFIESFFTTLVALFFSTYQHFFHSKAYHKLTVEQLIAPSLIRIFLQQIIIISSGFLFMSELNTLFIALFVSTLCFIHDLLFIELKFNKTLQEKYTHIIMKLNKKESSSLNEKEFIDGLFEN